jgi:large subunit ribosomal protein L29
MEIKEIRKKTDKELQKILAENRNKLREARFKSTSRQLKNYKELKSIKHDIARILTVESERRLALPKK